MIRKALPRLLDIDQNTKLVAVLVKSRTFKHFRHDIAFRYAVQFAVLVIAEAANHLPADLTGRYPEIPWRKLVAIGHKLRHEYFRIDDDIMWELATQHLPPLQSAVRRMIADADQDSVS